MAALQLSFSSTRCATLQNVAVVVPGTVGCVSYGLDVYANFMLLSSCPGLYATPTLNFRYSFGAQNTAAVGVMTFLWLVLRSGLFECTNALDPCSASQHVMLAAEWCVQLKDHLH